MSERNDYCLGVDIGGTKTSLSIFDSNFDSLATVTFASEPERGFDDLISRIGISYRKLLSDNRIDQASVKFAGVASPGPLDLDSGHIVHIATMGFKDEPLRDTLSDVVGLPVYLENDANCAALAEAVIGAGKGFKSVVYVTVSTGIGCGIVWNGRIIDGATFSAGELGHLTVQRGGKLCACGKRGCLEMYSSGTAISEAASDVKGFPIGCKEVFELAGNGDSELCRTIEEAGDKLGFALAAVFSIVDPDVIVLGGSVIKDYSMMKPSIEAALKENVRQLIPVTDRLRISALGGRQVIIGAAIYGFNQHLL